MNSFILRKELPPLSTIVVKCGSRILTGTGSDARIDSLARDLTKLRSGGVRVVLVSSGAITHGMRALGLASRPGTIPLQQACASVGQNRLMNRYQAHFEKYGALIGQVLLTWDDLRNKKRYLNLRNTLFALLDCGAIPIVNENDSVGVEEIKFGTNDILGAQIALLVQADLLVNLTDVGGLFTANPHEDPAARHVPVVTGTSSVLHKMVSDKKNDISVGGMASKLKAAEMVTRAGIFYCIGDGFHTGLLEMIGNENLSTVFLPSQKKMSSRRRWIAFSGRGSGELVVDDGARKAIADRGKSLLPAGIKSVGGSFKSGDPVDIKAADGTLFARGLANFSADDVRRIAGCKSSEIAGRLGVREFDEVVHRDNLVLL